MEAKNYSLESNVSVWSDFLRLHFHPRSLLLIPEYYHKEYVDHQETVHCLLLCLKSMLIVTINVLITMVIVR